VSSALRWQDHAVIVAYLAGMIVLGLVLARRQRSEDEYFLAGRRMPWFAVGVSVIASLLSSLTYLSEPGEVWASGVTHMFGKMLAIPFEMMLVWVFCIPFMMRFRFTSAYEYLEHRFGPTARQLGVVQFLALVVLWMGFVVLASARALAVISGMPLAVVILTVGVVATVYTMLGGLRAVIWTDVIQVSLLVGGGLYVIGYVAVSTGTWLPDWYSATAAHLATIPDRTELAFFSYDPYVRATVVTVALNMCIWHVCTHTANQMTVQRYYSTSDMRAARRSFVTGSLAGVGLNLMLLVVGLAMLYYYFGQGIAPDAGLNPSERQDRDLVFPMFAVHRLPAGFGGGILAALLAAAMSSIDSGVNSIATVVSVEWRERDRRRARRSDATDAHETQHVRRAQIITLFAGLFITVAAYSLDFLPDNWGIVDSMPRTFNAITGPIGGLFLVGMFLPFVSERGVVIGTLAGLMTSVTVGYWEQIGGVLHSMELLEAAPRGLSFTLPMPAALVMTFTVAALVSLFETAATKDLAGLTWQTRHDHSPLTEPLEL